ncbi:MAG: hypothetical protein ACYDA6_07610 [Solirubrobacteraceae bacterium]
MIMIDQSRRLEEPLGWTRAGRIAIGALLALLCATAIALGAYAAVGGFSQATRRGCVEVTFASTTGGARLAQCGAKARALCASSTAGEDGQIATELRAACRRAGYPFGG